MSDGMTREGDGQSGERALIDASIRERARHTHVVDVAAALDRGRGVLHQASARPKTLLFDLLDLAAEQWRRDPRRRHDTDQTRVAIVVTTEPALLVAHRGAPIEVPALFESIDDTGPIRDPLGRSLRSMFGLSLAPEIYSGLAQERPPRLSVGFSLETALELLRSETSGPAGETWDELVMAARRDGAEDGPEGVPILDLPHWLEEPPGAVEALARARFTTVFRLPFRALDRPLTHLDEARWFACVHDMIDELTDGILVRHGCFDELRIEDQVGRRQTTVSHWWTGARTSMPGGGASEAVTIVRNDDVSSRWRAYRSFIGVQDDRRELVVGLRVGTEHAGADGQAVLAADLSTPSSPFVADAPTTIDTGLPFLLSAPLMVTADGHDFDPLAEEHDASVLDELAQLCAVAVADAVGTPEISPTSLANVLGGSRPPTAPMASQFYADVMRRLDSVAWVPCAAAAAGRSRLAEPGQTLTASREISLLVGRVFGTGYVRGRIGLEVVHPALTQDVLRLIASRPRDEPFDLWSALSSLLRPGRARLWSDDSADQGFVGMLELLAVLDRDDHDATADLVAGLRGDPEARLLPVVTAGVGRTLLAVPPDGEADDDRSTPLVMIRPRASERPHPSPPAHLNLAFLADGLLEDERHREQARALGVHQFTLSNFVGRLDHIGSTAVDRPELLRFLWRLMVSEGLDGARDPREDQLLGEVPVPCKDGQWRRAREVGFGADWARWVEGGALGPLTADRARQIEAYQQIEQTAPGEHALLAAPPVLVEILTAAGMASPGQTKDAPGHDVNADRHTFLVRLGVAETAPHCARPKAVPSRRVAPTLAPDRSEPSMHDRSASRRIRRRTVVGALGLLMVVALGTLTRVLADPAAEQILASDRDLMAVDRMGPATSYQASYRMADRASGVIVVTDDEEQVRPIGTGFLTRS